MKIYKVVTFLLHPKYTYVHLQFQIQVQGHVQENKIKNNKVSNNKKTRLKHIGYNWDSTETSSAAIYITKESINIQRPKLQTR